ncbi:MAG: type III pantothenate kinase [Candidatus Omnitrophota bacterium]|nr:type III pantothenate kinase [Candidatus Omnitrophota bacterium]
MLLAIDIGNTTVRFGLFKGKKLVKHWWKPASSLKKGRSLASCSKLRSKVSGIIISSVVPGLLAGVKRKLSRIFGLTILVVGCNIDSGITNLYHKPKQVGSDRLVNARAGWHLYKCPLIIVDFGTAITFDVVSKTGRYLGGIIAPGVELSLEALSKKAALLPRIKLSRPGTLVGKTTSQSMASGFIFGFSSLCDGIIYRIKKRYRLNFSVIATGGGAGIIAPFCKNIDRVNSGLTLQGLRIIYQQGTKIDKKGRIIEETKEKR